MKRTVFLLILLAALCSLAVPSYAGYTYCVVQFVNTETLSGEFIVTDSAKVQYNIVMLNGDILQARILSQDGYINRAMTDAEAAYIMKVGTKYVKSQKKTQCFTYKRRLFRP